MNSEFPESPEDRLLDELLQEQSHGTDADFLRQLETAVDASAPPMAAEAPQLVARLKPASYGRYAVAASLILAGAGIWYVKNDHKSAAPLRDLAVLEKSGKPPYASQANDDRTEIVPGGFKQGDLAFKYNQETMPNVRPLPTFASAEPAPQSPGSTSTQEEIKSVGPLAESKIQGGPMGGSNSGSGSGSGRGDGTGRGFGSGVGPGLEGMTRDRVASLSSDAAPARANMQESGSYYDKRREMTPPEGTGGDRYGTFIDQPWKNPNRDPLSTFSIDVDTASYTNVRRMIKEGRAIPRDAVRIEECINAFSYKYEQPKGEGPFAVGATLAACPWNPKHQLVRVAIKGREIEVDKRPSSNLVFLIDVSGSMSSPDKLPLLKQSMTTLVKQLDERDRVAIVVYAGSEGVALPSTRLDEEGRAKALRALDKLESGGSTNGGAGIKRAYELAMKDKIEGGVNRVILATDGDFNVGVTGQGSLVELVKDRAKSGVYLTVLGFGTGNLNDAMMDNITRDGNGNYFYIDSEREGSKVFTQNLTGTLVTIAKDVKIQVDFNPAKVGGYRLIGYANRVLKNEDFNNDKVDAGDIGAGHTVTAFYELTSPGEGVGTDASKYQATQEKAAVGDEWLTVKLRYKHPEGDESRKIEFPLKGDSLALDNTDADFQFATAAALFGMKLRNMEEVQDFGWDKVIALATPGLKDDSKEDRSEFVSLLKKLSGSQKRLEPGAAEVIRKQE